MKNWFIEREKKIAENYTTSRLAFSFDTMEEALDFLCFKAQKYNIPLQIDNRSIGFCSWMIYCVVGDWKYRVIYIDENCEF